MVSSARASPSTSTVHTELNASYMSCIHQGPSINNVHGEGEGGHADKLREACMNFQYIPFAHYRQEEGEGATKKTKNSVDVRYVWSSTATSPSPLLG